MAAFQADDGYEEPHVIAHRAATSASSRSPRSSCPPNCACATVGKFQRKRRGAADGGAVQRAAPEPPQLVRRHVGAHREFLETGRACIIDYCRSTARRSGCCVRPGHGHDVGERNRL